MSRTAPSFLQIHPRDSVAVALRSLRAGERVGDLSLNEDIAQGHKFALVDHAPGSAVIKFGQRIGLALQAIRAGDHVHVHNLVTALTGEIAYAAGAPARAAQPDLTLAASTWRGYPRADGRVGTRNEVWILPTVGCVGITAEHVAQEARARHAGAIDGIYAFAHPHGCSQLGDDLAGTRAVLAGLAANPNAGGVLLLGLGCESNRIERLVDAVPEHARAKLRVLTSQSVRDEIAEAGRLIDELVAQTSAARRVEQPLSALTVGLKCGGSDAYSGLTANPLLGRFSETLSAVGGRVILTEIPEIFGAEQALLDRSVSRQVFDAAAGLVNRFKRYYLDQGLPVSENPSPGNLAGGITTLEEKSLGAVQKAGAAPLADVLGYGEPAWRAGISLLEAPGNDAVSATALAASGAALVLFTTGRGTPLGFPVPTIKIASNRELAQAKPHWIDFDATLARDAGPAAADAAFVARVVAVASGESTAAERGGQRTIAVWKRGVTL